MGKVLLGSLRIQIQGYILAQKVPLFKRYYIELNPNHSQTHLENYKPMIEFKLIWQENRGRLVQSVNSCYSCFSPQTLNTIPRHHTQSSQSVVERPFQENAVLFSGREDHFPSHKDCDPLIMPWYTSTVLTIVYFQ